MHRPLTFAVSLAAAAPAPAQLAGTYTVNPVWPASATNFPSLAAATAALAAAGVAGPVTIEVYDDAGPYTESSTFPGATYAPSTAVLVLSQWAGASATNRVTFQPARGESVVLDATGKAMGIWWGGADYVTVRGFEIHGATFDAISLYSDATTGQVIDAIIDGCRIHDCGAGGVVIYGNTPQPLNTLVQNCWFWRLQLTNAGSFNTTARFGYVTTRRSQGTRVVHNTFVMDAGVGSLLCAIGGNASSTSEVLYAELSNNIVVKAVGPAAPSLRLHTPVGSSFPLPLVCDSNCWFDYTGGPFAAYGASGATVAATLVDWQTATARDLASLLAEPLFLDASARNYRLSMLSPCLGASAIAAGVLTDIDGQPRTVAIDIGADEWSGASFQPVGSGCPGTGGLVPLLTTHTWPFLGNQGFAPRVERMPPFQIGVLFGSLGIGPPLPFVGSCTIHLALPSAVSLGAGISGPAGTMSVVLPVPGNPAFAGINLAYQALVLDGAAPGGMTLTNALDIVFAF